MTTVGYAYDPLFLEHDHAGHPERAARLRAIHTRLREAGEFNHLRQLSSVPATFDELTALHAPDYVSQVYLLAERGGGALNPDTYITPRSFDAAALAAGAAMRCASAVMRGEVDRAFALVRPPGHHAFADHGEGFCLFNNVAFAAKTAIGALDQGDPTWSPSAIKSRSNDRPRALIVDFDVHHGNGTESMFSDDPSVLFVSLHQYGHVYPGTGALESVGYGPGRGSTINVPMPPGAGDAAYRDAFERIVIPAARRFKPSVVIASAGFDAHWRDPLANVDVSLAGFVDMTRTLCDLADELCGGRTVFVLEGGYDLDVLSSGVLNSLRVMRGAAQLVEDPIGPCGQRETPTRALIDRVRDVHGLTD
jgi:acetoin utilization deacetylase AcuC-like enzyme